jgi:hypothetical protein
MGERRRVWLGGVWVAALLSVAQVAGADPVRALAIPDANHIDSGAYLSSGGGDTFTFTGPEVDIHQTSGATPPKVFAASCTNCTAGNIVDLSFRNPPLDATGHLLLVELGTGNGRIGDTTYPFLSFSGSLKFFATPFEFPDTTATSVQIETPFKFRGWIQAGTEPGPFTGGTTFRIKGQGLASTTFSRDGSVYHPSGNVNYTFQATTPEPSSLLLLGSGVGALARRVLRRWRGGRGA